MQLPLSPWLLILLGINRKIKCFPDVVFACYGNVHTPHRRHLCAAWSPDVSVGERSPSGPDRGLRSQLNGVRVVSAPCSNAPSQLDAPRLAALQLDAGFLIL